MSSVLERLQKANKAKSESTPAGLTEAVADKYLSDLKEKERENARMELFEQLKEASNEAELEGMRMKLEAAEIERNTLNELLTSTRSEVAQLQDLIKALKAEVKIASIAKEELMEEMRETVSQSESRVRDLEMALLEEKTKPTPAPQVIRQEPQPLPSFEFTPVRGPDGRLEGVTAKPI